MADEYNWDIHAYEGQANVTDDTAADKLYAAVAKAVTTMLVLAVGSIFASFWFDIKVLLGIGAFLFFASGIVIIAARKYLADLGIDVDAVTTADMGRSRMRWAMNHAVQWWACLTGGPLPVPTLQ